MAMKFSCEDAADASISLPAPMTDVPPSISLPVSCRGDAASIAFDISTFDGMDYQCSAEGEFILARSIDGEFEVQVSNKNYDPEKLSAVPRSVVFKDADAPTIQISVAQNKETSSGSCPVDLYVNGKPHEMGSLADVRVERIGQPGHEVIVVYNPTTGVQMTALLKHSSWLGCYFAIKVCLPDDYREGETLRGLFGSRDGNPANDWMARGGNTIRNKKRSKKRFENAYKYCTENWRIESEEESLFTYADDDAFEKNLSKYNNKVEKCVRDAKPIVKTTCGASMSCLSAGCSGDLADAYDAVDIENSMLEQRCGDLISIEDFNDGNKKDDTGWKEFGQGGLVKARRDSNSILGSNQFLGRLSQSNPVVTKKFKVPRDVASIKVEFDFYQLDNWMTQDDGGRDTLFLILNDRKLDLGVFDDPEESNPKVLNGISFRRESLAAPTNMGFNQEFLDQSHKVVVDVPQHIFQRGSLKVSFEADLSRSELMQSAGIDNFRLTGHSKQCRISWTGTELKPEQVEKAKKRGKEKQKKHEGKGRTDKQVKKNNGQDQEDDTR